MVVMPECIQCDVRQDQQLSANEEQNCTEPWLQFLLKLLKSLFSRYFFSVAEMCQYFSDITHRSSNPIQNIRQGFKSGDVGGHEIIQQTA
jgi:hypothetical protein